MIPQTNLTIHRTDWQQQLKSCIRDMDTLAQVLRLDLNALRERAQTPENFPLLVPQAFVNRMQPGNLDDPLLLQVLPLGKEFLSAPGFTNNPVGDNESNLRPGLIHKYHGRVLLIVSTFCAINCRYCFRRHFPYPENRPNPEEWRQALEYIAEDTTIEEVIYSGGDPLGLTDRRLRALTKAVADIPHIKRIRVHSRLPVVIPDRVTDEMLDWLAGTRLEPVLVLHINHPNEIDSHLQEACGKLSAAGITLLNQSVLLKNVNDQTDILVRLSKNLFSAGILPYYLHLLDKVSGAAHFEVAESELSKLAEGLRTRLPGYMVPRIVREITGSSFKQPLC